MGTSSYEYDNQRLVGADGPGSADYDYTYDKVGNITAETAGSTTTRYGYNRAGELCWKGPQRCRTGAGLPGHTVGEHDREP